MPTDQEVEQMMFGSQANNNMSSQPMSSQQALSDTDVENLIFGQQQQQQAANPLEIVTQEESGSPLSLMTRLKYGFGDEKGIEADLKKNYQIVEKLPNGSYAVGNTPGQLKPIDPEGIFNDVLGDMADIVGEIPVIAGQIIGTSIGAATGAAAGGIGAAPGAVIGSGVGAAAGTAAKAAIGKAWGIDERTANDLAWDIGINGALGAASEGLLAGTRVATLGAKKVLAPKLVGLLNKGAEKAAASGELPTYAKGLAKTFKYVAQVPEESTNTFFKYGIKEMDNAAHFDKNEIGNIVRDFATDADIYQRTLGSKIYNNVEMLENTARRSRQTNQIDVGDLFQYAKKEAQRLGVLDDFGKVMTRKNLANTKDIQPLETLLNYVGEVKNGRFVQTNKSINVRRAVQMSRQFGNKFDGVSPEVQAILYPILNGNASTGMVGLRQRITKKALDLGVKDFAVANEKYSTYLRLLDDIKLSPSDLSKTESFITNLQSRGIIAKEALSDLDRELGTGFLKRWELWNAGQSFTKSDLNILRFGAIAAILGSVTGMKSESKEAGMLTGLGGAALFGTPAGLKNVIRLGHKLGYVFPKSVLQGIGKASVSSGNIKYGSTVLNQLLQMAGKKKQ